MAEKNILSELVKNKREELKITQEEVAEELNVSRQTISKWENGYIQHMGLDKVSEYASLLKLPAIAFIYPESYLESEFIDQDYIDIAKKLQDNNIAIKSIEHFIDLVSDIKISLFTDLR